MIINNLSDIGKLIARVRHEQDLSGKALADKLETNQPFISRIEGDKTNITLSTLMKIARACGKRLYISIR